MLFSCLRVTNCFQEKKFFIKLLSMVRIFVSIAEMKSACFVTFGESDVHRLLDTVEMRKRIINIEILTELFSGCCLWETIMFRSCIFVPRLSRGGHFSCFFSIYLLRTKENKTSPLHNLYLRDFRF